MGALLGLLGELIILPNLINNGPYPSEYGFCWIERRTGSPPASPNPPPLAPHRTQWRSTLHATSAAHAGPGSPNSLDPPSPHCY